MEKCERSMIPLIFFGSNLWIGVLMHALRLGIKQAADSLVVCRVLEEWASYAASRQKSHQIGCSNDLACIYMASIQKQHCSTSEG